MTERDKKLLVVFAFVVALGILGLWLPAARDTMQLEQSRLDGIERKLRREQEITKLRPFLERKYAQFRDTIPAFPEGTDLATTKWLPLVDDVAVANDVNIARRSVLAEIANGRVTELPIQCTEWNARLDSLVDFLYQIENQKGAMMDVRALNINPDTRNIGMLRGTFTINCAYTRQASTTEKD